MVLEYPRETLVAGPWGSRSVPTENVRDGFPQVQSGPVLGLLSVALVLITLLHVQRGLVNDDFLRKMKQVNSHCPPLRLRRTLRRATISTGPTYLAE